MNRINLYFCLLFCISVTQAETVHISYELSNQTVSVQPLAPSTETVTAAAVTQAAIVIRQKLPPSVTTSGGTAAFLGYTESSVEFTTGCTFFMFLLIIVKFTTALILYLLKVDMIMMIPHVRVEDLNLNH